MNANTIEERITAVETEKKEATRTEVCFGAIMGIAAIAGIWGAASLLISFIG